MDELKLLNNSKLLKNIKNKECITKSYTLKYPTTFTHSNGLYLYDIFNTKFIDCLNGFGVNILGHNHPIITETAINFFKENHPFQILDMSSDIRNTFIDTLFNLFPKNMKDKIKIQFSGGSGSDAVESAIELAIKHTGRNNIFAFSGCYHGMTNGSMSLTGNISDKYGTSINTTHLPFPHSFRCPFGIGGDKGEDAILHYIKNILDDPKSGIRKPCAIIMELVQSDGGIIIASKRFVKEIRKITKKHNILLIIDEVQTGFGKTGTMFAFEQYDIIPDILVFSKALGCGMPLSAIVFDKNLDLPSHGTFRGNQLAMVLGYTSFNYIIENNILTNVIKLENYMYNKLTKLQNKYSTIGEIRIKGLLFAVEFTHPNTNKYYPEEANRVFNNCFNNGLLCKLGGRNNCTLIFWLNLLVSEKQLDDIINVLDKSIK